MKRMPTTTQANVETGLGRPEWAGRVPLIRPVALARGKAPVRAQAVWVAPAGYAAVTALALYCLTLAPRHVLGPRFDIAVWALGLVTVFLCQTAWRRLGRFDPFLLPVWFAVNLFVQVFATVWLFGRDDPFRYFWLGQDGFPIAVKFLALSSVATVSLLAGFLTGSKFLKKRRKGTSSWGGFSLNRAIWVLGVAWGAKVFTVFVSEIGFLGRGATVWTNYLYVLEFVSQVALLGVLLLWLKTRDRRAGLVVLVGLALEILPRLYAGSKSFVFPLIWVVACWFYARGRLPKKHLVLAVLVTAILVPVVNTFRHYLLREGGESRAVLFREATGEALSRGVGEGAEETLETAIRRQSGVFHFSAAIVAAHPDQQPYVAADMVELIAASLVPRVFWPSKPTAYPELYLLGMRYMGTAQEYSFATPGLISDLYRTGGWPLTVLGGFGVGWLAVLLYRAGPGSENIAGIAFYVLIATSVLTYDRGLYQIVMATLHVGVPGYLVAFHYLNREQLWGRPRRVVKPRHLRAVPVSHGAARQGFGAA